MIIKTPETRHLTDFRAKRKSARRDSNGDVPEKYRKDAGYEVCPVGVSQ